MGPLLVPQEDLILGYLYALNITITEVIRLKEYNLTGNTKKNYFFSRPIQAFSGEQILFSILGEI